MHPLHPDTRRRIAPLLQRVLIVDAGDHPAQLLAACLGRYGADHTRVAADPISAWREAEATDPTLIFTEAHGDEDPFALVRDLRRSALPCRQAPIVVLTTLATRSALKLAKDAGAHQLLHKPFSPRDLGRQLDILAQQPPPWVEKPAYTGPDRRFFNTAAATRRLSDRIDLIGKGVSASRLYLAT